MQQEWLRLRHDEQFVKSTLGELTEKIYRAMMMPKED